MTSHPQSAPRKPGSTDYIDRITARIGELRRSNSMFSALFHELGHLSDAEIVFLTTRAMEWHQATAREQEEIQRQLTQAIQAGDRQTAAACRRELHELTAKTWNVVGVLKCKLLIRRKGTQRSSSRNGAQTISTHTSVFFDGDLDTGQPVLCPIIRSESSSRDAGAWPATNAGMRPHATHIAWPECPGYLKSLPRAA